MIGNVAGGVTVGGEFGDIATVIVTPNRNFALPGIHMMTIKEGGDYFRDPFHRLNHFRRKPVDTYAYEPATHADWFWYMGQQEPVRLPYGFAEVKRGRHWILAHRVAPLDAEPVK